DAVGEAFDKASKLLGLGYPGGPAIQRAAERGDPAAIRFPRAHVKRSRFDFSFSGVKTALRLHLAGAQPAAAALPDIAASIQEALAAAGLRPRKRWGQHFLCDPAVAQRIVDAAALGPDSVVLEIGPGLGALTDELAARAARLYLVEIDRGLTARLAARYAERP